jgi:hypothetical protein
MTGEKNRGASLEKLWKLDDETLTTPEHDKLIMLFFNEDFKRRFVSYIESSSNDIKILGVSVKEFEHREVIQNQDGIYIPDFVSNRYDSRERSSMYHKEKYCSNVVEIIKLVLPYPTHIELSPRIQNESDRDYSARLSENNGINYENRRNIEEERDVLRHKYVDCHYTNWILKHENELIQKRIDTVPKIQQCAIDMIKTSDPLDWYSVDIQSEVPIITGHNDFIVGYWDIVLTIEAKSRIKDYIILKRNSDPKQIFIEVKPRIDSFGKVLRQLNTYKQHQKLSGSQYIALFTEDTTFQDAFEKQGIAVIHPSDI